jgi:hypothetical protein
MCHDLQIESLIACWPNRRAFADAVGVNVDTVHKWVKFGRIPSGWQFAAITAAQSKGIGWATADWMVKAHAFDHIGFAGVLPSDDAPNAAMRQDNEVSHHGRR